MITQTLEVEEPRSVFGKLRRISPFILFPGISCCCFLVNIGALPFLLRWNIAQGSFGSIRGNMLFSSFKNSFTSECPVRVFRCFVFRSPHLFFRILLFDHSQELGIPILRVTTIGFTFHVIPPHIFLPFGECPGGLASHGASLTGDTTIDIEDEGKLPLRMSLLVGITHLSSKLPIVDFRHSTLS